MVTWTAEPTVRPLDGEQAEPRPTGRHAASPLLRISRPLRFTAAATRSWVAARLGVAARWGVVVRWGMVARSVAAARFGALVEEVTARAGRGWRRVSSAIARRAEVFSAVRRRVRTATVRWTLHARAKGEAGMSTAEYAVGTIAACGFAALLFKIVTSAEVRAMLAALIQKALKLAG
jgi:hypothetical protein